MNNKKHSIAKILILIPIIIWVVTIICMGIATILERPTNRGPVYSIIALIGILNIFLAPLPCLVVSIVGTVIAAMAVKEGNKQTRIFFVIGIFEILVYVVGVILACIMLINGQSV